MDEELRRLRRATSKEDPQALLRLAIEEERINGEASQLNALVLKLTNDIFSQISHFWFYRGPEGHWRRPKEIKIDIYQEIYKMLIWAATVRSDPDVADYYAVYFYNTEESEDRRPMVLFFAAYNAFDRSITFSVRITQVLFPLPERLVEHFWPELAGLSHRRLADSAQMKMALVNWTRTFKRRSRDRRDRYTVSQDLIERWLVLKDFGYFTEGKE